ncbi:hypothetical protein EJB05_56277, partial [Eragrostis curvula]
MKNTPATSPLSSHISSPSQFGPDRTTFHSSATPGHRLPPPPPPPPRPPASLIQLQFAGSAAKDPRSVRRGDLSQVAAMINFVLLISRQGKVRLTKWYSPYTQKERTKCHLLHLISDDISSMSSTIIACREVIRELSGLILSRGPKLCNFVEWRGYKVVYRRYASLYFCMCIDADDNELEVLEIIHHFVEILDRYFGSVCELDLIFNFHKAYYILDEILIAGELQESSKKNVARLIAAQDSLVEAAKEEASSISNIIAQATK